MVKFVDVHQHFWKLGQIYYPWLMDEPPLVSNPDIIQDYLPQDYLQDASGLPMLKSVHVEALPCSTDRIAETAWLQNLADLPDNGGFPHGIVAAVDLLTDDFDKTLEGHFASPNLRGVRQILNPWAVSKNLLCDDTWRTNYSRLADWNLTFDMHIEISQMRDGAQLAKDYPNIHIALNHAGLPNMSSDSSINTWYHGMRHLASCENIFVKLSGFGMLDHKFSTESIRPIILETIDMFGSERCMFGSNFPVSKPYVGFCDLWEGYVEITSGFTSDEINNLFLNNAARFYRL